jgi:hypothetical protein
MGSLGAIPVAHFVSFFPTPAAGYVRLGILARRGLVWRFSVKGSRWVMLSSAGAAAADATPPRTRLRITERRAALVSVHCLLTSCGYVPASPPPAAPRTLQYYGREGEVLAVAVTVRPPRRGWFQELTHPIIFSPASRAVSRILVFGPGTTSQPLQEVPGSWRSRILLMPIPDAKTAEIVRTRLLAYLRDARAVTRSGMIRASTPTRTKEG